MISFDVIFKPIGKVEIKINDSGLLQVEDLVNTIFNKVMEYLYKENFHVYVTHIKIKLLQFFIEQYNETELDINVKWSDK
jgi:hypothetical protein